MENYTPSKDEVIRDEIDCQIDRSIALKVIAKEIEVNANFGNMFLEDYLEGLYKQIMLETEKLITKNFN